MRFFKKQMYCSALSLCFAFIMALATLYLIVWFSLPDVRSLVDTPLQAPLKIYTQDQQLIAEFGEKQRIPVPYHSIPSDFIWAVLSTEDQRFFEHGGVDLRSIVRAAYAVIKSGQKRQGASTITMQVARNFYLTRKKTFSRKIKEVLLAIKIDQNLSKQEILSLYFNKIYFGNRSYGVGAAARNYYGKTLDELTLAQMAMLAGLPQAPSRLNPIVRPSLALKRRNHVLRRMLEDGKITQLSFEQATKAPITATKHSAKITFHAPYLAEFVRKTIKARYGDEGINMGLTVTVTVNSKTQRQAQKALQKGLMAYDLRHGFRGSEQQLRLPSYPMWSKQLTDIKPMLGLIPAVVLRVDAHNAWVGLANQSMQPLSDKSLQWAMYQSYRGYRRAHATELGTLLHIGDVVWVHADKDSYHLRQIPKVQGALVAIDPQTGAIEALVGGIAERGGGFNRATQAWRQPGSGFKPFVYAAALEAEHGGERYTLASQIEDNPVVVPMAGEANELWRPENDRHRFYGALTLRESLMRSNNLITIRLLRDLGVDYVHRYMQRFGFDGNRHPRSLSLGLGAGSVTPLQLTAAYASFAHGGSMKESYVIDRIVDAKNNLVFDHDQWMRPPMRHILPTEKNVTTPEVAFLVDSALKSVIKKGTGRRARVLGRNDLAGKTGTTNRLIDAWFVGYQPRLATGVWVGFDDNRTVREYGAGAALPIWIDFMKYALRGKPSMTLPMPNDVIMAWVNKGQENAYVEYFIKGTEKQTHSQNHAVDGLF